MNFSRANANISNFPSIMEPEILVTARTLFLTENKEEGWKKGQTRMVMRDL